MEKVILKETKKHKKHTALTKPLGGDFHQNEWALLGAPCSVINKFANDLGVLLSKNRKVGYVDASHEEVETEHPFDIYYHDKQAFAQIDTHTAFAEKQNRKHFSSLDLLLINGNHFKGDKQIVFINDKKKESLNRKLDRLTDLRMVIVENHKQDIHDFIKPLVTEQVAIFKITELKEILNSIIHDCKRYIPKLNGLVLAGGKSSRMGKDKGTLMYHDKPQREYEADLLKGFCEGVFLSLSQNQKIDGSESYPIIKDSFIGLGPYGAILSAFRAYPNQAWLTVACDLSLLNNESLSLLVEKRNPSKLATCFHNPDTNFPEPLITIWEPRAYPVLLEFLSHGYSCPRKVLINTEIEEIHVDQVEFMANVNDPKTYELILGKIRN